MLLFVPVQAPSVATRIPRPTDVDEAPFAKKITEEDSRHTISILHKFVAN